VAGREPWLVGRLQTGLYQCDAEGLSMGSENGV
jgi:hypothetical protein